MIKDKKPHVSIVILNWNGWKDTIECLESLYQINYPNFTVILVDNYSTDDSIEKIKSYCKGKIKVNSPHLNYILDNKPIQLYEFTRQDVDYGIIKLDNLKKENSKSRSELYLIKVQKKNIFFTGGCNLGIKFCIDNFQSDYVLLLNNDMVFEKNFLNELVYFSELHQNKNVGILNPRICYYDAPETNQWLGFQDIHTPIEVYEASGSALLIKVQLIHKIGFLDQRFGVYHEDVDYCFRAKKAGYKVYYIPTKDKILHKGSKITKTITGYRTYYSFKNQILLNVKHKNHLNFIYFLFRFLFKTIFFKIKKAPLEVRKCILKGVLKAIKQIIFDPTLLLYQGYRNFYLYNEYFLL